MYYYLLQYYQYTISCQSILPQNALRRDCNGKCIEIIEGHYLEVVVLLYLHDMRFVDFDFLKPHYISHIMEYVSLSEVEALHGNSLIHYVNLN